MISELLPSKVAYQTWVITFFLKHEWKEYAFHSIEVKWIRNRHWKRNFRVARKSTGQLEGQFNVSGTCKEINSKLSKTLHKFFIDWALNFVQGFPILFVTEKRMFWQNHYFLMMPQYTIMYHSKYKS